MLKKVALPILGTWYVIRWLLDFYGRLQGAKDFFDHRGTAMKWAGIILTSQWLPLGLFLAGVAVLFFIYCREPKKKKVGLPQPIYAEAGRPTATVRSAAISPPRPPPLTPRPNTGVSVVPPPVSPAKERSVKLISTIESRIRQISGLLDKDSKHLDAIANYPPKFIYKATQEANFADLFEVEKELLDESLAIYKEVGWSAFCDLWQSLLSLNRDIKAYNQTKTARSKNDILRWTIQIIPKNLADVTVQSAKSPL